MGGFFSRIGGGGGVLDTVLDVSVSVLVLVLVLGGHWRREGVKEKKTGKFEAVDSLCNNIGWNIMELTQLGREEEER